MRNAIKKAKLTEKEFAVKIGCAQSTLHGLLHKHDARHSTLVPLVHEELGWAPPPTPQEIAPPMLSSDAIEMANLFDRLPEKIRQQLRDQAMTYIELLQGRPDRN